MTKLSTPKALEESMMVFMQGMRTSHPSRPKRFSDDHFLARNSSNLKQQVDDVARSESLHLINLLLLVLVFTLSGSGFVNVGAAELWRILNRLFTSGLDTHMKHGKTHTPPHTHTECQSPLSDDAQELKYAPSCNYKWANCLCPHSLLSMLTAL